jgi:hypothetical protein
MNLVDSKTETTENKQFIRYQNVRVDRNNIKLIEDKVTTLIIPKDKILDIKLIKGSSAKKPIVLIIVGLILIFIGALPIPGIIEFIKNGGVMFKAVMLWPGISILGILLFIEAFRKRWLFEIRTIDKEERIVFDGKVNMNELIKFV